MLEKLVCVFRADGAGRLTALFGTLPEDRTVLGDLNDLRDIAAGKPSVRKAGEGLLIAARPSAGDLTGFLFSQMPAVTELPKLARKVHELVAAGAFSGPATAAPNTGAKTGAKTGQEPGALVAQMLARQKAPPIAKLLAIAADALVSSGAASAAAAFHATPKGIGKIAFSDQALSPSAETWRSHIQSLRSDKLSQIACSTDDGEEDHLTDALLIAPLGGDPVTEIVYALPAKDAPGYGFVLCNAPSGAESPAPANLRPVLELIRPLQRNWQMRRMIRRAASLAALVAACVYLSLPAPRVITAKATVKPLELHVVALHFASFQAEVLSEVGASVAKGAPLAVLTAPDQTDALAATELQILAEDAAAATAFSQGDYGAYSQAEARRNLQRARLGQIQNRLDLLNASAPIAGRIVQILPSGDTGRYLAAGTAIAKIQPEEGGGLELLISQADVRHLQTGQSGWATLRGFSGDRFDIEIETAPAPQETEEGETVFLASARLSAGSDQVLLSGLTGFAQIDTGEDIRARVWARHVMEFMRLKAWTILNWRL